MDWRFKTIMTTLAVAALVSSCQKDSNEGKAGAKLTGSQKQDSNITSLEDMSWLIGKWKSDEGKMKIDVEWKKGDAPNVMSETFKITEPGQKEVSGYQMIKFDPATKRIRSSIYDSKGGSGKAVWFKKGNAWYAKTSFTNADGQQASSLNIYTKVDNNNYTFASENRDAAGKVLPNLGPFKLTKK